MPERERTGSDGADDGAGVERVKRGDRGFLGYGRPWRCTYGTEVETYESSAASDDHLWLNLRVDTRVLTRQEVGEGTAHLNREQVETLAAQLRAWLDDHPRRPVPAP